MVRQAAHDDSYSVGVIRTRVCAVLDTSAADAPNVVDSRVRRIGWRLVPTDVVE